MKYMTTNKHMNWGHRMVEFFITDDALRIIISSKIIRSIGTRSGGSGSIRVSPEPKGRVVR